MEYNNNLVCTLSALGLWAANSTFMFMPGANILFILLASICGGSYVNDLVNYKWDRFFTNVGMVNRDKEVPKLLSKESNDIGEKYIFSIPMGFCLQDFEKIKNELEFFLNEAIKFDLTHDSKLIIQKYQNEFKDEYKPILKPYKSMLYPIGVELSVNGEKETILDLINGSHTLVGGMNGSGKTSVVKTLLTYFCLNDFEVKIIDMKMGGDYNVFRDYRFLTAFIKNIKAAEEEIQNIKKIMQDRFNLLDRENIKDYHVYNEKYKNKMHPIIVVIDEYTMLSGNKGFNEELNIILAMARAVNIKVILSIQRPCHENLNTKLKANLNNTIAFKCKNTYNSEILLDKGDYRATELVESGEAILYTDNQDLRFKAYYLTDKEIKDAIRHKCTCNVLAFEQPAQKNKHKKNKKVVNLLD